MNSQSRVTYALGGRNPEPRNAFGLFVGFFQRRYGSGVRPSFVADASARAWFGQSWNASPVRRTASPMLIGRIPPSTSDLTDAVHAASSTPCIASYVVAPISANAASHCSTIGYGGDVTTRWTDPGGTHGSPPAPPATAPTQPPPRPGTRGGTP